MKKSFEKKFSLNVARLKYGAHQDHFEIDQEFFQEFDYSMVEDGEVHVHLDMFKTETHLDVKFSLSGFIMLPCDRCLEPYRYSIYSENRIIYAFDPDLDFPGTEVMYVDHKEPYLVLVQEIYDFIHLEIPLRRVPAAEEHLCAPEVLALLGLDDQGKPQVTLVEEDEEEIDPRWESLRKLKDSQDN